MILPEMRATKFRAQVFLLGLHLRDGFSHLGEQELNQLG